MTTTHPTAGLKARLGQSRKRATHVALLALVAALLATSDVASAQTSGAPTPGEADHAPPSGEQERPRPSTRLTWAVTERVRYSGLFNQFRPGLSGDDRSVVFRTTLKGELAWRRVTLAGEVQDVRAYLTDEESNLSTALVNAVDVVQAYMLVGRPTTLTARAPELQIGRFAMELGSGRLIAQEAYRDVPRTFTGAKVRWPPHSSGRVTAFAVVPVAILPEGRDGLLRNRIELDTEKFQSEVLGCILRTGTPLAPYSRGGVPLQARRT